jgi:hypothetical protein
MPDNLLGGQGATLLTAIIIVAVALLALVGVFWLIRNRAASTFIRGGKNRQPRLAVLDATAVDTRRRLVLIRRDDVEHLVMIGGPTDIVIESRIARHDNLQATPAAQPRQQRAAPPAAEPVRPARAAAAPTQAAQHPVERQARSADTAAHPTPPQARQQPASAPLAAASAGATAAPADSARSEAADLLETARNRVFEEPTFDDVSLDDDLSAAPKPAPSAPTRQQPASASRQEASQAPMATAGPGAGPDSADPIQAKAVDVLETVRTRVFEEPSFDESAFDELTSAPPEPARSARPAPAASATAAPSAATGSGMATSRPAPAAEQTAAASSDFETVLAAELSQDLTVEPAQDSFITAQYSEHQLDPEEAELLEAPEVQPETQESRDSLEAEMERLLGDLSRKT